MVNCVLCHFLFYSNELAKKYNLDTFITAVSVRGILLNKIPL